MAKAVKAPMTCVGRQHTAKIDLLRRLQDRPPRPGEEMLELMREDLKDVELVEVG